MSFLIRAAGLLGIIWILACSGCARLTTDYGKTRGPSGSRSLNGFGALREAYYQAGFRDRDVSRLSDRVMRADVIVWTPQMLGSVDSNVTRWFERWLGRGDHTLVYIVPDSGSEADYWADAAAAAPPEQRLEYRKRAARSVNERMMWRLNRRPVLSNGWFMIETLTHREKLGQCGGRWKQELGEISDREADVSVEYHVIAFDEDKNNATKTAVAANTGMTSVGPTGPGTPNWQMVRETKPTKAPIRYSEMLRTEDGKPVVIEITSKNWRNSRIIAVAGGSLLTNYAFSRPMNRRLADQIIAASIPSATRDDLSAGFLSSSWNEIPVSENEPGVPKATGMELLTVWPISLVTMHGVVLGLVICLMLLPIFGRPKRIRRSEQNEFGHHLDAVAALMNKAGGESYARARISEYMKRMHGETTGPWVIPDPVAAGAEKPPVLRPRRIAAKQRIAGPPTDETAKDGASSAETIETSSTGSTETTDSEKDEADR